MDVGGRTVVDRAYPPRGLFRDGNSLAVESIAVASGRRHVEVRISGGGAPLTSAQNVEARAGHRNVVLFDKLDGWSWF